MTTIRGNAPVGNVQRLDDTSTRIPFSTIDDGNGLATRGNLEEALGRVFPSLTQPQAEAMARAAFEALPATSSGMDANAWSKIEPGVMVGGAQVHQQNQIRGVGSSGWLNATGLPALPVPMVGAAQIPLSPSMYAGAGYMPRNDFAMTGFNPYQYPMGMPAPMLNGRMPGMPGYETPGHQAATGVGRGILGFLKMMPGVGNIINGIDFVRDIGKGLSAWANPNKTFGEKLKAGADLLFHGAGMFVPQVGGAYDMAQGAVRTTEGMMRMGGNPMMGMGMLPPFNYAGGGIPNAYNMQYLNPMMQRPFAFNQFPNYSMYPPPMMQNQAFMPPWLGGANMFRQPFPMLPFGANPMMMGRNPMMNNMFMGSPAMMSPQFGTPGDAAMGALRSGVGAMKMAPGLGNVLNGIDFVRDIGHVFSSLSGNPQHSFLKSAADLLFHGAGMLVPQVGGAYDMAQGAVRMGAGGLGMGMGMGGMGIGGMGMGMGMGMNMLPPFAFNRGIYPPVYNSGIIF